MPKNLFQNVIFTLMMSFLMVYVMICYNISLNIGGMSNKVFLMAFGEMKIMWPVAFLLEFFIVDKLAHALAFRMVTPNDRPIVITLAISAMIICIMCPVMSLIATVLFKNAGSNIISTWFQTTFFNFPVAFFWQMFYYSLHLTGIIKVSRPKFSNVLFMGRQARKTAHQSPSRV